MDKNSEIVVIDKIKEDEGIDEEDYDDLSVVKPPEYDQ